MGKLNIDIRKISESESDYTDAAVGRSYPSFDSLPKDRAVVV